MHTVRVPSLTLPYLNHLSFPAPKGPLRVLKTGHIADHSELDSSSELRTKELVSSIKKLEKPQVLRQKSMDGLWNNRFQLRHLWESKVKRILAVQRSGTAGHEAFSGGGSVPHDAKERRFHYSHIQTQRPKWSPLGLRLK